MLPLRDENPTSRKPFVTVALILACVGVYFFVQPSGSASVTGQNAHDDAAFTVEHAAIPCEIVQGRPLSINELRSTFQFGNTESCSATPDSPAGFPDKQVYLGLLLSMFLHGGLLHLGGNMLFLWVFGNNVEDRMGAVPYLLFYLAGGLVATFAHVAVDPNSTVPVIGASGAVAAVMGTYLVLHPKARVHSVIILIPPIVFFRSVPAWGLLGFWFISQFAIDASSGVAWAAHVGGFVFGVVGGLALRSLGGNESR